MLARIFSVHPQLRIASRLQTWMAHEERLSWAEWATLLFAGMTAALASGLIELHAKVPGHAILKATFPIVLGLAAVPRRGAGTIMSCSAILTSSLVYATGLGDWGLGALTSLLTLGPIIDLFTARLNASKPDTVKSNRSILVQLGLAGLSTNILALIVKAATRPVGKPKLEPFASWLLRAVPSYLICGFFAGALCGLLWFSMRGRTS